MGWKPVWLALCAAVAGGAGAEPLLPYRVTGDAIPVPLVAGVGDPARGRGVVVSRDANCLLCHALPEPAERPAGNLAPPLTGVGSRLSEGELRLRIVDSTRLNRDSIMPAYYRTDGLNQVATAWRGKPILTAQQVEDVVAYLRTLR